MESRRKVPTIFFEGSCYQSATTQLFSFSSIVLSIFLTANLRICDDLQTVVIDLLAFFLFLFGLCYFGLYKSQKVRSESSHLLADRSTHLFALTATLVMTELNTATLLSFSSMGYIAGSWALTLPAVLFIGLFFYAATVSKKWKEYDKVSVASFFSERYGRDIGLMASLSLLLAMSGFSAAYVKSLFLVFSPFFPLLNPWILSGALILLVLVATLRGGLFSIIRTDVYSFLVLLIFFPLMVLYAYKHGGQGDVVIVEPKVLLPPRFVLSLIVLTMFTYILAPWYGQKIFSARSKQVAFLAVVLSALIVFFLYSCAVLATWLYRKGGATVLLPEQALPQLIVEVLPRGLRGLGYAILLAASTTTLSGVWSAMSSLVIGDFLKRGEKKTHVRSMVLVLFFGILSWILANLLVDRVFDKLILANIPVAALAFALIGGFYWKRASRFGAYMSILFGWVCGVGSYLLYGVEGGYTWYWALFGIPTIFISGIIFSLLFSDKLTITN